MYAGMHLPTLRSSVLTPLACAGALAVLAGCSSDSDKGGSGKSGSLAEFTQFLKDHAAGSKTHRAKYPAGKAFTMSAKALADGSCGAAQCSIKLTGTDPKSFMSFELTPDQKNVASIKTGQVVTLSCTPEYKEGAMWTGKGCTVK
jgi:hypothetical protein